VVQQKLENICAASVQNKQILSFSFVTLLVISSQQDFISILLEVIAYCSLLVIE